MASKAMDLFEAYTQDKLPKDEGYIVSSFFSTNSTYSRYEVVSYSGVKSIYLTEEGLTFQTNGRRLYLLIEPPSYPNKAVEPYLRTKEDQIPMRFSELDILTAKNQTRMMVAKQAVDSYSSFTILRPTGINFSLVFYRRPDLFETLGIFFEKTFNKEAAVPMADAKKAAKLLIQTVQENLLIRHE